MDSAWLLRPATTADTSRLHALFRLPEVYRYLADGAPPPRQATERWISQSAVDFRTHGFGLWLLENERDSNPSRSPPAAAGCLRLERRAEPLRTAEITWVLHPRLWGRGLATRMGWTGIQRALAAPGIDQVLAGTDDPNVASVAVMRRLGMTFLRQVQYPAWPGVEYVFRRGDPAPVPLPSWLPRLDASREGQGLVGDGRARWPGLLCRAGAERQLASRDLEVGLMANGPRRCR